MRFKSKGGTRPDDVGTAPAFWGMTEAEYKAARPTSGRSTPKAS